jgi:hypothetical protein
LIWGGHPDCSIIDGALFDPVANSWTPVAPAPAAIVAGCNNAAWTARKLVLWGSFPEGAHTPFSGSAVYDPEANSWSGITPAGAPGERALPALLARDDGTLIVWGGQRRYDPDATTPAIDDLHDGGVLTADGDWKALHDDTARLPTYEPALAFAGDEQVLAWGGVSATEARGGLLDLASGAWRELTDAPATLRSGANFVAAALPGARVLIASAGCGDAAAIFDARTGNWRELPHGATSASAIPLLVNGRLLRWGGAVCADGRTGDARTAAGSWLNLP